MNVTDPTKQCKKHKNRSHLLYSRFIIHRQASYKLTGFQKLMGTYLHFDFRKIWNIMWFQNAFLPISRVNPGIYNVKIYFTDGRGVLMVFSIEFRQVLGFFMVFWVVHNLINLINDSIFQILCSLFSWWLCVISKSVSLATWLKDPSWTDVSTFPPASYQL